MKQNFEAPKPYHFIHNIKEFYDWINNSTDIEKEILRKKRRQYYVHEEFTELARKSGRISSYVKFIYYRYLRKSIKNIYHKTIKSRRITSRIREISEKTLQGDEDIEFCTPFTAFDKKGFQCSLKELDAQIEEWLQVENMLEDRYSKLVLLCMLMTRVLSDLSLLAGCSNDGVQYFDAEIWNESHKCEYEVFVDCGAYSGDTAFLFMKLWQRKAKLYLYEFDNYSYIRMKKNMEKEKDIICRNAGVGKCFETVPVIAEGNVGSRILEVHELNKSNQYAQIVTIDDDIQEKISFIKMDIEGSEMDALEGAKEHISSEAPKLAICVYHKEKDILQIPRYIASLNSNYIYSLRHYSKGDTDTILYAIPKETKGAY